MQLPRNWCDRPVSPTYSGLIPCATDSRNLLSCVSGGRQSTAPPCQTSYEPGKESGYLIPAPGCRRGVVHPGEGGLGLTGRRIGMHVVEEVWLPKRDPKLATYLAHFTPPPQRFPPPPPPQSIGLLKVQTHPFFCNYFLQTRDVGLGCLSTGRQAATLLDQLSLPISSNGASHESENFQSVQCLGAPHGPCYFEKSLALRQKVYQPNEKTTHCRWSGL